VASSLTIAHAMPLPFRPCVYHHLGNLSAAAVIRWASHPVQYQTPTYL